MTYANIFTYFLKKTLKIWFLSTESKVFVKNPINKKPARR